MDEPVAMRYDFDGYGYKYIDSGSGSDWQTREKGEFLYTKPFFNQKPVAMMVKIDGFDKPEFTTTCSSAALKHPNYTALYDHPMRELSDATIRELSVTFMLVLRRTSEDELFENVYEYSKLLLKKASEMTDKESAIYATGYWNGIAKVKLRELTDEEITQIVSEKLETWNTKEAMIDFARAILRKAQDK